MHGNLIDLFDVQLRVKDYIERYSVSKHVHLHKVALYFLNKFLTALATSQENLASIEFFLLQNDIFESKLLFSLFVVL